MPTEIAEIKDLLKELIQTQKETADKFKETDAAFKASQIEREKRSIETDVIFKETAERFKETAERFKETDAKFKETDQQIKKAFQLFESQWGKLIESLVTGDLIQLLRARGIKITDVSERRKGSKHGMNYEFDIIAHNGNEIVVVEVKTTLRAKHIKTFLEQLKHVKLLLPEYANYNIYGAVAFLNEADSSSRFAENQQLFVIKATGNSASIVNALDFQPRTF